MNRLVLFLFLFVTACGFDKPAAHVPDAGTTTCTFNQSALDLCVLAP